MGAFLDGEWDSICKLFTVEDSPELSANFLEYYSPASEQDENNPVLPAFISENSPSSPLSGWISNNTHNFLETRTQPSSTTVNSTDHFLPDILSCIDFSNMNGEIDASLGLSFPQDHTQQNDVHNITNNCDSEDVLSPNMIKSSPKRKRDDKVIQDDNRVPKKALKGKRRAHQKAEEEMTPNADTKETNETAESNTDDSNACVSEELNETADSNSNTTVSLTSTGKKRASRGNATDPQSLYARRRRMRINERLRILQSLVPNGTKVDISTMLEEAFHYVKFLQLQIRLLSSDELWMYAPLAYNGLDVGDYRRMSPFMGL